MTTATAACTCEKASYTITGIALIETVDNECPQHGLPLPAVAATREMPQPRRKQSLPTCRPVAGNLPGLTRPATGEGKMTTAIISPVQTNLDNARARVRQASDRLYALPSELGLPQGPDRDRRRQARAQAQREETAERTILKAALEAAYKSHAWQPLPPLPGDIAAIASCPRCGDEIATWSSYGERHPLWTTPAAETLRACPGAA